MKDLEGIEIKYFPKKTLYFFVVLSKYYAIIKEQNILKNIEFDYDTFNGDKIDIKRNGKKESIEFIMLAKYDKKTEIYKWGNDLNEHFRKILYKNYGKDIDLYGGRYFTEQILQKEFKIEEKYHYLVPYLIPIFFPEFTIVELYGKDILYYGLAKLGIKYNFTVGDVIFDYINATTKALGKSELSRSKKRGSKNKDKNVRKNNSKKNKKEKKIKEN